VGPVLPAPERLAAGGWEELREARNDVDLWPMLHASEYVRPSPTLERFIATHRLAPGNDPLASARELRAKLFRIFEYVPGTTTAQSPIESILETGRGVCQDYAHVMASILRKWGIPCRYVSGYLAPVEENVTTGESHAWVEGWFPGIGWLGFDPTNDTEGDERHVRVAVGRDYADVPPTRGVFLGTARSRLETEVVIERW
jgi:transglutaminase-like putative cysteine protease